MKYKDLVPEIKKFINVVRENNRIGMEHFHTNEKELYEAFDGDLVDENTINEDEASDLANQMEKQDNAAEPANNGKPAAQPQQNNQQNNNNSGDEYYNMVYGANGQPVGKQGDNNAQASDAPKPPSKPNRNYTPEEQKMYDKMYNQYLQQEMLKKENQNKAKELELRKQGQKLDNSITATNAQQNQNQNQQQNTKDNGSNEGGAKRLIDSGWLKSIRNTGMWKSLSNSRLGNWLKNTSLWKNISNIYKGGQQQANNPQGDTPTLTPLDQNTPAPANDANKKEEELAKQMEKQDNAAEPANNGKPAATQAPAPNAQKPANNNGDKEYNMIYGANGQPVGNQSNNTTAQHPTTTPPTQNDIGAAEKPTNEPPKEGEKDKEEEDIANQMAQMSGANGPQK